MALPTKSDIITMDFSYNGLPFVDVPGNTTVDLMTMDWSWHGMPFVSNNAASATVRTDRFFLFF